MRRIWIAIGGFFLLSAALWVVAIWPTARPEEPLHEIAAASAGRPSVPVPSSPTPPPNASPPAAKPASLGEPAEEPPVAPQQPPEQPIPPDIFAEDQGPVAEYKQRFANEPRDSAATEAERTIRAGFAPNDFAIGLFKSVLCRETICKIEVRMSPERFGPYVAAMTRISLSFDHEIALSPVGTPGPDHTRLLEVYFKRH
jgi:hypothetical protein